MFQDKNSLNREEKRIRQTASDWLAERDAGWEQGRESDFDAWKSEDIRHEIAVRDLGATWNRMLQMRQLIDDPTLRPNPDILTHVSRKKRRSFRRTVATISTLAAVLLMGLGIWITRGQLESESPAALVAYTTTFNDYKQIGLDDGSILEMNANTKVEIDFTDEVRQIYLLRGEAHFQVTKDKFRPFLVDAGAVAVKAVGTAFNVRYSPDEVQVLVTEGRVSVKTEHTPAEGDIEVEMPSVLPELIAGDQATIFTQGTSPIPMVSSVSPEEISVILAWKGPRLFFNATPLEEAVSQFNEYNLVQVMIDDEALRKLSIGGSFLVEDVEAFIRLLAGEGSVIVERPDFDTIVLKSSY